MARDITVTPAGAQRVSAQFQLAAGAQASYIDRVKEACLRTCPRAILIALLVVTPITGIAYAAGARSFKSGPIQITADGSTVWVVNPDHDSVSRLDTATDAVVELPLPQAAGPPVRHNPTGLSVMENGAEVWVACHDSDRVYVLRGTDGTVLARIDLPWGSGPRSVALSRDQTRVLVTLLRAGRVAVIDRATRQIVSSLETFRSPLGVAFMEDGVSAWITHRHVLDRLPRVSRVDLAPPGPRVTTQERTDGAGPPPRGGISTFAATWRSDRSRAASGCRPSTTTATRR